LNSLWSLFEPPVEATDGAELVSELTEA
jgi:hypothetical protein